MMIPSVFYFIGRNGEYGNGIASRVVYVSHIISDNHKITKVGNYDGLSQACLREEMSCENDKTSHRPFGHANRMETTLKLHVIAHDIWNWR